MRRSSYIALATLLLCLGSTQPLAAQNGGLNDKILAASFPEHQRTKTGLRTMARFKHRASYFNPLSYAGAGLLFIYQNVFSEQIQADCTYMVSCSQYTKLCIERHGILKGTLMGFNQLSECFPAARYEHPVTSTHLNKIDNRFEAE